MNIKDIRKYTWLSLSELEKIKKDFINDIDFLINEAEKKMHYKISFDKLVEKLKDDEKTIKKLHEFVLFNMNILEENPPYDLNMDYEESKNWIDKNTKRIIDYLHSFKERWWLEDTTSNLLSELLSFSNLTINYEDREYYKTEFWNLRTMKDRFEIVLKKEINND